MAEEYHPSGGGTPAGGVYPEIGSMFEGTQLFEGLNENTMINSQSALPRAGSPRADEGASFGLLHRLGGKMEEFKLKHRVKDNIRDKYIIGRNYTCDIVVNNKMVSSSHCAIYCDWTGPRLVVYLEDMSANGTYVNDKETKLKRGQRIELKSGDEIFLINPSLPMEGRVAQEEQHQGRAAAFMFVNLRERLAAQRSIATAPHGPAEIVRDGENAAVLSRPRHIEDSYVIGDQIGSGMCGTVHICTEIATKHKYAVKIIDTKKFGLQPGLAIGDLKEEARMMMTLDHPHIVRVQDTFEFEHMIYIVMELVDGGDLFDRIVSKQRYTEQEARQVMVKVLDAVSYLHSRDIIHRDLKPENILLTHPHDDCDIKLTDFGLAKRTNQDGLKTFCGTPQYFAPEVLMRKSTVKGLGSYGRSADMWSIGVILFILLSGTFPFEEDNLLDAIESAQYSTERDEWVGVSQSAKHLVQSLMTLRPDRRVTVEQAQTHPWILGNPSMPHGFSFHDIGTAPTEDMKSVRPVVGTDEQVAPPKGTSSSPAEKRLNGIGGAVTEGQPSGEKKKASIEGVWQHFKQPHAQSQSQSQGQVSERKSRAPAVAEDSASGKRARLSSFRKGAGSKGAAAAKVTTGTLVKGPEQDAGSDREGGRGGFDMKHYLLSPSRGDKRGDAESRSCEGSGANTSLYSLITGRDEPRQREDLDSHGLGLAPRSPPVSTVKTKARAGAGAGAGGRKSAGRSPARRSPLVAKGSSGNSSSSSNKRGRERSGSGDAAAGTACLESFWGKAAPVAPTSTRAVEPAERGGDGEYGGQVHGTLYGRRKIEPQAEDKTGRDQEVVEVVMKKRKTETGGQSVVTPLGKSASDADDNGKPLSTPAQVLPKMESHGYQAGAVSVPGAVVSLEKEKEKEKENFPASGPGPGSGPGSGLNDAGDSASVPMPTEGCLKGGSLRTGSSRRKLRQPIKNLTFADIFKRPTMK